MTFSPQTLVANSGDYEKPDPKAIRSGRLARLIRTVIFFAAAAGLLLLLYKRGITSVTIQFIAPVGSQEATAYNLSCSCFERVRTLLLY